MTDATLIAATASRTTGLEAELALVREMEQIAEIHRDRPDRRIAWLIDWIEQEMCPGLRAGRGTWNTTRWNPSRLEQRNGRIDRKLQPAPVVTCRYFVFPQRPEDRVLDALVRKSDRIHRELGSMAQVLEARSATMLARGIRQREADALATEITDLNDGDREATIREELEAAREGQQDLQEQIDRLRRQIRRSEQAVGIDAQKLRQALSTSLGLAGAPPIREEAPAAKDRPATFRLPADAPVLAGDLSWAPALDLLREPRQRGETVSEWRAHAAIRPVTFDDTDTLGEEAVQLHLEHRVVQRLLARFASQGLLHLDLTRSAWPARAAGRHVRSCSLGSLSSARAPRACMRRSSPSPPAGQTPRFATTHSAPTAPPARNAPSNCWKRRSASLTARSRRRSGRDFSAAFGRTWPTCGRISSSAPPRRGRGRRRCSPSVPAANPPRCGACCKPS
ncbi:MAG: hypothetical protein ACP5NI_05245 [Acetobacteraceae bacterium]